MHRPPERGDMVWGRNLFYGFRRAGDLFDRDAEDVGVVLQTLFRAHRADDDCALFQTFNRLWNRGDNSFVGGAVLLRSRSAEALVEPAGGLVSIESARRLYTAAKNEGLAHASV